MIRYGHVTTPYNKRLAATYAAFTLSSIPRRTIIISQSSFIMAGVRRLLVASVVAAGLAGTLAHNTPELRRRKTLGFGPALPHSVFASGETVPQILSFGRVDPFDVAKEFAKGLTADTVSPASSFYVRDDSYTDKNTGVTHVYLRQTMFGMEVADGDINVNVKDGRVLSYGDSVSDDACRVTKLC